MNRRISFILIFSALIAAFLNCCMAPVCGAQVEVKDDGTKPAQSIEELQQQLEQVLTNTHTPGLSIAIVQRDHTEWIAGLGTADVASNRAATSTTLFRIGSISKGFVSLSILKLVKEGKLSLDDSVRKLIPEIWFENRWEASDPVRIVNLLEHTTGWDEMNSEGVRLLQDAGANSDLLASLECDHLSRISRWPPGTRMSYNNGGPRVAAYIVEKITGQRFEDYVRENFFSPIGMKTATYFQPVTTQVTTTYLADGRTAVPYLGGSSPSGSINASAEDMAAYLRFYLNRGTANGVEIMPASSIDRMEIPTSTWAAKQGLKYGYGLGNTCVFHDGFVYHGHNGHIFSFWSELAYLRDDGVGYFYSINSANLPAYLKIGEIIREYLTHDIPKPAIPPIGPLTAQVNEYAGWYEPDLPNWSYFEERLLGMMYVSFPSSEKKMNLTPLLAGSSTFFPVSGTQFREPSVPQATADLIAPESGGRFIQFAGVLTYKRIPTWFAVAQIVLTVYVLLSMTSIVLFAPFWLLAGLSKKRRRPTERALKAWPLVAVLSLAGADYLFSQCNDYPIYCLARLATPTCWSIGIFGLTILFALASLFSALAVWRTQKEQVRRWVQIYSAVVSLALLVATSYLAFWGVIGFRSWIQL